MRRHEDTTACPVQQSREGQIVYWSVYSETPFLFSCSSLLRLESYCLQVLRRHKHVAPQRAVSLLFVSEHRISSSPSRSRVCTKAFSSSTKSLSKKSRMRGSEMSVHFRSARCLKLFPPQSRPSHCSSSGTVNSSSQLVIRRNCNLPFLVFSLPRCTCLIRSSSFSWSSSQPSLSPSVKHYCSGFSMSAGTNSLTAHRDVANVPQPVVFRHFLAILLAISSLCTLFLSLFMCTYGFFLSLLFSRFYRRSPRSPLASPP